MSEKNKVKLETKFVNDPLKRNIITDLNFGLIFWDKIKVNNAIIIENNNSKI